MLDRLVSRVRVAPVLGVALVTLAASVASADVSFGPHDVATVFFVSKSDDHNRVDYGIRLDGRCQPVGGNPITVYWREFEGGRDGRVTHGLNVFEGPAYGVDDVHVVSRSDAGAIVTFRVRAVRDRPITVATQLEEGRCEAHASISIRGQMAALDHVHLTLTGPGQLAYADLVGRAADGVARTERIQH